MAAIIKSFDADVTRRTAAFNFDDMAVKAEAYVRQVRDQALQAVAEAKVEAERICKQAEVDGLKAAQSQFEARVQAEAAKRMETVLPALRAAVAELEQSKQAWLSHWQSTAVRLATRIAGRILRRDPAVVTELPLTLIRESLELAVGDDGVRVLLHPQDIERLGPQIEGLIAALKPHGRVDVVGDERIGEGGCRLESRHGSIDQQIETQLRRIEEELI